VPKLITQGRNTWVAVSFEDGKTHRINVTRLARLDPSHKFIAAIINTVKGQRPYSQVSVLVEIARVFGNAIDDLELRQLPTTSVSWQRLISDVYKHHFTSRASKGTLDSAIHIWNSAIARTLERLQQTEDFIPVGVVVQRAPWSLSRGPRTHQPKHIGDAGVQPLVEPVQKLLLSVDLSRTDAEYLNELRADLVSRREFLHEILLTWWHQVINHFEYGNRLLSGVRWPSVKRELDSAIEKKSRPSAREMVCGSMAESMARQLCVILNDRHGDLSTKGHSSPYMYNYTGWLKIPLDAPPALPGVDRSQRVAWMLGYLSPVDIAVCSSLLIMHNPNFTPYAVLDAKLTDARGKPRLEIDGETIRFRVEKPRARAMKHANLDETSAWIIESVVAMSSRSRALLSKTGSPLAKRLFFTTNTNGDFGPVEPRTIGAVLNGQSQGLYRAFKDLGKILPKGTITLRRIRATEGVLEWFRTGSLQAMRRKLGNTYRVTLRHYLPASLLAAWNTRIVRRFQNLWIAVAAANEPFLLKVTDFNTITELHQFLGDIMNLHSSTSSPLASELHRLFGGSDAAETELEQVTGKRLAVNVSKQSLCFLYLYQEAALKAGISQEQMRMPDSVTGICPKHFLDLADLMKHEVAHRGDTGLRNAHNAAIEEVEKYRDAVRWSDLMIQRDARNAA
jgi:hypothetical protein